MGLLVSRLIIGGDRWAGFVQRPAIPPRPTAWGVGGIIAAGYRAEEMRNARRELDERMACARFRSHSSSADRGGTICGPAEKVTVDLSGQWGQADRKVLGRLGRRSH
jgi:hypothetical protein